MPLISSPIPNLVNGVSQQAAALRLASQLEAQENAFSSVVEGLGKRSPSKHIVKLSASDYGAAFFHLINRDVTERYLVVCLNDDLKVFDLAGVEKTVSFPDGKAYLDTATPNKTMRALTVADFTFIVNTSKVTAMTGTVADTNQGKALISIKQGQYGTTYSVRLDGVLVSAYQTSASTLSDIQTENIANQLMKNMGLTKPYVTNASYDEATGHLSQTGQFASYTWAAGDTIAITGDQVAAVNPGVYEITGKVSNDTITLANHPTQNIAIFGHTRSGGISGPVPTSDLTTVYNFQRTGSTILITKIDGSKIDCTVEDTFGNKAMTVATTEVQRFSDLPTVAPDGFVTKILGDNSDANDDYYVKFVATTGTGLFGTGNWVETVGPAVETTVDLDTMPFTLVRNGDGTFTFKRGTWSGRTVGDALTSPNPSFIGDTIQDVFFYRNRLGFLSQENVILSAAGSFFTFFSQTVTTILDSDPVDVAATHTKVSFLKHAVPFNEELLLFSDQVQFVLQTNGLLTPQSPSIDPTTEFEASLRSKPVGAGSNVYFAFSRGLKSDLSPRYSGVREYFVDKNNTAKDAADITAHVPKYIPGEITKLAAATNEDVIVALSADDQVGFYVYKYYWNNDEKLQSSWSRYSFETNAKVVNAEFIESVLYLTIQRSDGCYLESMSFEPGQVDASSAYVTLLDRRVDDTACTVAYNATTDRTTWTLPYTITSTMQVAVRAGDTSLPEGVNLKIVAQGTNSVSVSGDKQTSKVYIGQSYTMRCRLSEPVLREEAKGGGMTVNASGRLQIRRFILEYSNSGYFRTEVTPIGRSTSVKTFNAITPGVSNIGEVSLRSDSFPFTVFTRSDSFVAEIVNDSFLPSYFTGAEFEAFFTTRSARA